VYTGKSGQVSGEEPRGCSGDFPKLFTLCSPVQSALKKRRFKQTDTGCSYNCSLAVPFLGCSLLVLVISLPIPHAVQLDYYHIYHKAQTWSKKNFLFRRSFRLNGSAPLPRSTRLWRCLAQYVRKTSAQPSETFESPFFRPTYPTCITLVPRNLSYVHLIGSINGPIWRIKAI
jgi:hypothetical protein